MRYFLPEPQVTRDVWKRCKAVAELDGLTLAEHFNIIRYKKGQLFVEHYDFADTGVDSLKRSSTFLIYLCDYSTYLPTTNAG